MIMRENKYFVIIWCLNAVCNTQAGNILRNRPTGSFSTGGVFAIQCRHGLYRSNGVADFPKGERYVVMCHANLEW